MDSITQIVLGAAVGEAVLGKKVGNKAMLYGAVAGTIPDLDVLASYFTDTVTALALHRGFTHSILFSIIFAPIFGWLVSRYEKYENIRGWSWLFFWAFLTHPILDSFTTWGTQLFWPFNLRLAFKTIFVIDPLYTLPFLIFLILAMGHKRSERKRVLYNNLGLIVSSTYLIITCLLKWAAFTQFTSTLDSENIDYLQIDTRPAAMNTILWNANVELKDAYLLADYSFFDTQSIEFKTYPKNHELLGDLIFHPEVKRMIKNSENWFTIIKKEDQLLFNDLRFGVLSTASGSQDFVFQYVIEVDQLGAVTFTETKKDSRDSKKLVMNLWDRIKGN